MDLPVKVAGSNRQQSTPKRPVQLLYPLEIRSDISTVNSSEETPEPISEQDSYEQDHSESVGRVDPPTLPKRDAAQRARKVTKDWIIELEKDDWFEQYVYRKLKLIYSCFMSLIVTC